MLVTLFLSVVLMAALFLMILVAVALVRDNRLFTTAPKDIQAAALEHEPPFPGARVLGWILLILCALFIPGAFVCGARNGKRNRYGFGRYFGRFITMLLLWKAFDIVFLDWFLLTRSQFFQHFYPETKDCAGYHQFGFNRKEQLIHTAALPFAALLLAWFSTLLGCDAGLPTGGRAQVNAEGGAQP